MTMQTNGRPTACAGAHLDDLLQKHRGRNDVRDDDHSSLVLVIVLTSSCSGFCWKKRN